MSRDVLARVAIFSESLVLHGKLSHGSNLRLSGKNVLTSQELALCCGSSVFRNSTPTMGFWLSLELAWAEL